MAARQAICIVIDGLRASALGAYGGLWHSTPCLDQLASQSLLVEWMWTAGPDLRDFYEAFERGSHSLRQTPDQPDPADNPLQAAIQKAGVQLSLATDDPWLARRCDTQAWEDIRLVDIPDRRVAASIDETALANLFAVAAEQWLDTRSSEDNRLAWIHARGWHGPWDAPMSIKAATLDEDDPPPLDTVDPPELLVTDDPDVLLVQRAAYAAQTAVLDDCVGNLLTAVDATGQADQTLVVLVGARGFALGEHGIAGCATRDLYSELLHTPLLVRPPGTEGPIGRTQVACHPADLTATILDWFAAGPLDTQPLDGISLLSSLDDPQLARRQWNLCECDEQLSLRTPAWMIRESRSSGEPSSASPGNPVIELYTKPDDRWETNEISGRCPEIVERLLATADLLRRSARCHEPLAIASMDEDLIAPER